jgi:hypothetical protein
MLPIVFHYTQIVEKDGRSFLYDPQFVSLKSARISALNDALSEIKECLEQFNYPTGEAWVRAIADGGADGLCALMVSENDREAKRMKVPQFIANQWRKSLVEDTPRELINQVNALHSKILREFEDLPVRQEDIVFNDGKLTVDADTVIERIKTLAMREITEDMKKEAEIVKDIVDKARTLQNGFHILDVLKRLMGNWLAPSKFPDLNDDILVFTTINAHRHNSREQIKATAPEWYYLNGGE